MKMTIRAWHKNSEKRISEKVPQQNFSCEKRTTTTHKWEWNLLKTLHTPIHRTPYQIIIYTFLPFLYQFDVVVFLIINKICNSKCFDGSELLYEIIKVGEKKIISQLNREREQKIKIKKIRRKKERIYSKTDGHLQIHIGYI